MEEVKDQHEDQWRNCLNYILRNLVQKGIYMTDEQMPVNHY